MFIFLHFELVHVHTTAMSYIQGMLGPIVVNDSKAKTIVVF